MKIITLASRNIFRNRARTIVTTLAMAFACSIMIIYSALMEGMIIGSERQAVIMNHGDIQIHAKNYRDDPDIYTTISDSKNLLDKIRSKGFYATARRYAFGLIASDESSSGVKLSGMDLIFEKQVTEIHKHVIKGSWLDKNDPYGVVIGKKLSRLLGVAIGDELVFIGQTADGYMANEIFKVRGILKSISAGIDSSGVFISDQSLINLLALPKGAHEIAIMRSDRNSDLQLATQQIADIAVEYETLNWRKLMPVIARFLDTADVQTLIMLIFTYIAVASVVLNAMLMSVFERIHEFGIMKAIGVTPWQSIKLIYVETLILTSLACVIGLIFGLWVAMYFQTHGLDMSGIAGDITFAGIALDPIWYAHIDPKIVINPIVFLFLISILAVIYPAIKIAKIRAVDAIHYQ
jgi:ABC-type lipoprotein release transport system permease subunit